MEGIDAREAERRWCNDPMPSAEEDKAWWGAALVLAGIEPAVTNAMRAATDIALPSSRTEEVGDRRKNCPASKADQVRLDEQIKRSRLIAKILWRWSLIAWDGRERYREEEDNNVLGGEDREEREQVGWERTVGEKGSERLQERNRRK